MLHGEEVWLTVVAIGEMLGKSGTVRKDSLAALGAQLKVCSVSFLCAQAHVASHSPDPTPSSRMSGWATQPHICILEHKHMVLYGGLKAIIAI